MTACLICGNTEGNREHEARETMFGLGDRFLYLECGACGCVQLPDPPQDLSRYYPAGYYSYRPPRRRGPLRRWLLRRLAAHHLGGRDPVGRLLALRWGEPEPLRWTRLAGADRASRILDVGCGGGELLLRLRAFGFADLTGVDPYLERDREPEPGVRLLRTELADVAGTYDLIMFHHSFEHLRDGRAALREARRRLSPRGRLLLRLPVADGEAWRRYGVDWVQLDPPRHLFLHTAASLRLLAREAALAIERVEHDSTGFQFWGSEQIRRGIPLRDPRSVAVDPAASPFPPARLRAWEREAAELNRQGRGDQAAFYLAPRRRSDVVIEPLAERPEHLPVLARWHHREWARYNPGDSLEARMGRMREHLRRSGIPITFVATIGGAPVGSAALVERDMHGRDDLSPWLASVFVAPSHRRRGIAGRLVERVVREAAALGVERLHLFTPDQEALYAGLGWRTIERTTYMEEPVVIMAIEPASRAPGA